MLILTVPHVRWAVLQDQGLCVHEHLYCTGEKSLSELPCCRAGWGRINKLVLQSIFWKFDPVYPLEKNIVKTFRLKFVMFVLRRSWTFSGCPPPHPSSFRSHCELPQAMPVAGQRGCAMLLTEVATASKPWQDEKSDIYLWKTRWERLEKETGWLVSSLLPTSEHQMST